MAEGLQNYPGVSTPDSDYPNGNIVDGATPVNTLVYADAHQTFAKVLRDTSSDQGTAVNNYPENELHGFQYLESFLAYLHSYKLRLEYAGTPSPGYMDSILPDSGKRRCYVTVPGLPANRTLYLPNSTGCTDLIYHRYENNSAHNLTVTPDSGDTLDGSGSGAVLAAGTHGEFVCIVADNNWIRVK
jgi:hypothetical protein